MDNSAPADWFWQVELLGQVGSTNDELAIRAAAGAGAGLVLATTDQTAGHGRLGRRWQSPAGTGLALSALVPMPTEHPELVPLAAGLAVAAVVSDCGVAATVKWPNDVLLVADGKKVAGVLCRALDATVVVGIGINVRMSPEQLPTPQSTALSIAGINLAAETLVNPVLDQLRSRIDLLLTGQAADVLNEYRRVCGTLGSLVRVELPSATVVGRAVDVDDDGCLLVDDGEQVITVTAGDVVHVRPG